MINIKSNHEIDLMRNAGKITAMCMQIISDMIEEGVSTKALDEEAERFFLKNGATPSFKGYNGYPASICASVNEQVVHGIPNERKLQKGDIVGIDMGAYIGGYHGDMARTFAIGDVSDDVKTLIDTAKDSFDAGLQMMTVGNRLGDVSYAIQQVIEGRGFSAVRALCGHGIGKEMHEDPEVPNFGRKGRGVRLQEGMVLAVEPMVNQGTYKVNVLSDGWTIVTEDYKLSAHYENTVLITGEGPEILTLV
jgi:methionyl aminopeptidase